MANTIGLVIVLFVSSCGFAAWQEAIVRTPGFKPLHKSFLALLHSCAYAFLSLIELIFSGWTPARRSVPLKHYFIIACFAFLSVMMANQSLSYIDYSTRVLFKSGKAIPVMLVSTGFLKKSYSGREYWAAFLLAIGLATFTMGDALVAQDGRGPPFSQTLIGLAFISIALFADACVSTYEQKMVFGVFTCPPAELIFFTYLISACCSLPFFVVGEDPSLAHAFFMQHWTMAPWVLASEVCGYLSVSCVVRFVAAHGATRTELVKTVRKGVTLGLSYTVFGRQTTLGWAHLLGCLLFLVGTVYNVVLKSERVHSEKGAAAEKGLELDSIGPSDYDDVDDDLDLEGQCASPAVPRGSPR